MVKGPMHKKEYYSERKKDIIRMYEKENLSLETIGRCYGITKQAVSLILRKSGYLPKENKQHITKNYEENTLTIYYLNAVTN